MRKFEMLPSDVIHSFRYFLYDLCLFELFCPLRLDERMHEKNKKVYSHFISGINTLPQSHLYNYLSASKNLHACKNLWQRRIWRRGHQYYH